MVCGMAEGEDVTRITNPYMLHTLVKDALHNAWLGEAPCLGPLTRDKGAEDLEPKNHARTHVLHNPPRTKKVEG
jgi:hypothetical protein